MKGLEYKKQGYPYRNLKCSDEVLTMKLIRFESKVALYDPTASDFKNNFPSAEPGDVAILITPKRYPLRITHPWRAGYYSYAWLIIMNGKALLLWNHEGQVPWDWVEFEPFT